jgi:anti-sigma factor RsiW
MGEEAFMNCVDFEKLIALDVEGDSPKQEAGRVAAHLETCRHCHEFAAKLKASQALLKELGQDAPDEATLQEVRRGILNRLPNEAAPAMFPAWRYALGAGLLTLLIFGAMVIRHQARTIITQTISKLPTPAATEATVRTPASQPPSPAHPGNPTHRAKKVRAVTATKSFPGALSASAKQQPEPLMIKLLTDNPNVVIYWQVD